MHKALKLHVHGRLDVCSLTLYGDVPVFQINDTQVTKQIVKIQ